MVALCSVCHKRYFSSATIRIALVFQPALFTILNYLLGSWRYSWKDIKMQVSIKLATKHTFIHSTISLRTHCASGALNCVQCKSRLLFECFYREPTKCKLRIKSNIRQIHLLHFNLRAKLDEFSCCFLLCFSHKIFHAHCNVVCICCVYIVRWARPKRIKYGEQRAWTRTLLKKYTQKKEIRNSKVGSALNWISTYHDIP